MPKQTPQQKLDNKQRHSLLVLCNRIASAYNFKQIKTWGDVYKMEGMDSQQIEAAFPGTYSKELLYVDLKKHFDDMKLHLEATIAARNGQVVAVEEKVADNKPAATNITPTLPTASPPANVLVENAQPATEQLTGDNDYGLHPSPNEVAFHFWFQKKLIKEVWDGIMI